MIKPHDKTKAGIPIQDTGNYQDGYIPIFHTHGFRNYMGTAKYHLDPDCRHLVHWQPGRRGPHKLKLGKTIIREWEADLGSVPESFRCKTCWKTEARP